MKEERERDAKPTNRQKFTIFQFGTVTGERESLYRRALLRRHASFRMGRACNGSSITDLWTKLKRPVAAAGRREGARVAPAREWGERFGTRQFSLDISRERISLSLSLSLSLSRSVYSVRFDSTWCDY